MAKKKYTPAEKPVVETPVDEPVIETPIAEIPETPITEPVVDQDVPDDTKDDSGVDGDDIKDDDSDDKSSDDDKTPVDDDVEDDEVGIVIESKAINNISIILTALLDQGMLMASQNAFELNTLNNNVADALSNPDTAESELLALSDLFATLNNDDDLTVGNILPQYARYRGPADVRSTTAYILDTLNGNVSEIPHNLPVEANELLAEFFID